ncbi:hypothetical protein [Chryseobacterium paridis]|uniref:Copper resistance protein NlpE n=1 Tax=Chryseobacterium paridis TaxID=2800328 RepID=A0ABS1FWY7_9FLAO|nr:hypothetical protein [Chryseobacterium paridis]MBK1896704.1 hypothetical protein [Chryseobacterium paridis]
MKKTKLLLAVIMTATFSIAGSAQKMTPKGGDKDKHGCIASAGYTYSVLKDDCVKLFEEKIQLKEANSQKSYVSNAVVILSKDKKKAELFLPDAKGSVILNRTIEYLNTSVYKSKKGSYNLNKEKDSYTLKRGKKIIYSI